MKLESFSSGASVCVIASNIAKTAMSAGDDNHKWKRHVDKNMERHRFQMDLGTALMNTAISRDWKDPKTNNKPDKTQKRLKHA